MHAVGYVVPSWSPTRLADGQIALRTMSWSIDTMTVWATTALVALDQCATQHLFDRRQVLRPFPQAGTGIGRKCSVTRPTAVQAGALAWQFATERQSLRVDAG